MKERPVFFTISGKLATHTSVLQNQSASADQSSLLGAAFATAFSAEQPLLLWERQLLERQPAF
jgi:hypothetical protein